MCYNSKTDFKRFLKCILLGKLSSSVFGKTVDFLNMDIGEDDACDIFTIRLVAVVFPGLLRK